MTNVEIVDGIVQPVKRDVFAVLISGTESLISNIQDASQANQVHTFMSRHCLAYSHKAICFCEFRNRQL